MHPSAHVSTGFSHQKFHIRARQPRAGSKKDALLLCVDDSAPLLHLQAEVLAHHGYNVVATTWPAEAIAMFQRVPFSAILTDFDMPEMNGDTLVKHIRNLDSTSPIMLHSGSSSLPASVLQNVNRFVPKGGSVQDFLRHVDEVVDEASPTATHHTHAEPAIPINDPLPPPKKRTTKRPRY